MDLSRELSLESIEKKPIKSKIIQLNCPPAKHLKILS